MRSTASTAAPTAPRIAVRGLLDATTAEALGSWDGLAQCAAEPNPFLESWYLAPALRALDPGGRVRLLVLEQDGRWLGLLPLTRATRYYGWPLPHLRSWVHANCFLGLPLVARGHEEEFWRALLAHADRAAGTALFLHLTQVPLDGALHRALVAVAKQEGRALALVHRENRALLASNLAPDAYLEAALSGKKRKELRRQFTRLSEQGMVAVSRQDDAAGLDEWIAAFLALEAAGWKGAAGSALAGSPATAALFAEALAGGAARGRLERLTLTLDGRPIAMLATFLTPPGAFSYKTAFDEEFARFSPGVLLQRENLALLSGAELEWCDSCAAADHPMIDHLWRERRTIGRISIAIGGGLRRAVFQRLAAAELSRRPVGVTA